MTKPEFTFVAIVFVLIPYVTLTSAFHFLFKEIKQDILISKSRNFVPVDAIVTKCALVETRNGGDSRKTKAQNIHGHSIRPIHPLIKVRYDFNGNSYEALLNSMLGWGEKTYSGAYSLIENIVPGQKLEIINYTTDEIAASAIRYFSTMHLSGKVQNKIKLKIDPENPTITEYDVKHEKYWIVFLVLLTLSFPILLLFGNSSTFGYNPNKIILTSYPIFLAAYVLVNVWVAGSKFWTDGSDEGITPKFSFSIDENFNSDVLESVKITNQE